MTQGGTVRLWATGFVERWMSRMWNKLPDIDGIELTPDLMKARYNNLIRMYNELVEVASEQEPRVIRAVVAAQELAQFKQKVIDVTRSYDAGCADGKRDFLSKLGLEMPKRTWTVTLKLEEDEGGIIDTEYDGVGSMVENAVHSELRVTVLDVDDEETT